MAVAIIVLGKENSPKYLACLDTDKELQFRYKMHTALDFIEEKLTSAGKPSSDIRELYLGQLYAAEDYKLYGYVTNTKIKFIIAVDPANMLRDNDIRSMFRTLHTAYADAVCCPFYVPGSNIKSPQAILEAPPMTKFHLVFDSEFREYQDKNLFGLAVR